MASSASNSKGSAGQPGGRRVTWRVLGNEKTGKQQGECRMAGKALSSKEGAGCWMEGSLLLTEKTGCHE